MNTRSFLPLSLEEVQKLGWKHLDFIFVTGDAYVDHPSFGAALLCRLLQSEGYRVGIIAQPNWKSTEDFLKLGKPKLGFLVSSGNMDSMVAHYTANKKLRSSDAYSPAGQSGMRPDRALIVYCNRLRESFKGVPIIIGGLEASLRRLGHYDYWSDTVRRSILLDSKADLLVYGMGEKSLLQIAEKLNDGISIDQIKDIRGTVYTDSVLADQSNKILSWDFEPIKKDKKAFSQAFLNQYQSSNPYQGIYLAENYSGRYVIQNPPSLPLNEAEMDRIYDLDFLRQAHPFYQKAGGVPALKEVRFSIQTARGCYGACHFCAISLHQGKIIQRRSASSIIQEAEKLSHHPDFKGIIHDLSAPTLNFLEASCPKQKQQGNCKNRECLFPSPCKNLKADHEFLLQLLSDLKKIPGIKKVFLRSGLRHDYLLADPNAEKIMEIIAKDHISGQLKVAPENASEKILALMGKPSIKLYQKFKQLYQKINLKLNKKQYLIPYYICSHPGSRLEEAIENALFLKNDGFIPDQVQDFYPTPGTVSTCMYYTEMNPFSGEPIHVPQKGRERRLQRALLQFNKSENKKLIIEALKTTGRQDLLSGKNSLLPQKTGKKKKY